MGLTIINDAVSTKTVIYSRMICENEPEGTGGGRRYWPISRYYPKHPPGRTDKKSRKTCQYNRCSSQESNPAPTPSRYKS